MPTFTINVVVEGDDADTITGLSTGFVESLAEQNDVAEATVTDDAGVVVTDLLDDEAEDDKVETEETTTEETTEREGSEAPTPAPDEPTGKK